MKKMCERFIQGKKLLNSDTVESRPHLTPTKQNQRLWKAPFGTGAFVTALGRAFVTALGT